MHPLCVYNITRIMQLEISNQQLQLQIFSLCVLRIQPDDSHLASRNMQRILISKYKSKVVFRWEKYLYNYCHTNF